MHNIGEILNHILIFNLYWNTDDNRFNLRDWVSIASLFVSIIATIIIPLVLYKCNARNQKLQALHQKRYEFWLSFGKSFFVMQQSLTFLLKKSNLEFGIVYNCTKEEVKNNLLKLINEWKVFYEKVQGNQKIYLESAGIDILILQTLISALGTMLKKDEFVINEKDNFSTITAESMRKLVTEAKLLFENNVKRYGNKKLDEDYINALNYYIKLDKDNSTEEIDVHLTYEKKLEIINNISNDAYLKILNLNFKDIEDKIIEITKA